MSKLLKNQKYSNSTLVIIDDDEAAKESLAQMLRLRSFKIHQFSSAEEALNWEKLKHVDCIIVDVMMPGIGGEGFLNEMNNIESDIPIIMVTGHGDISMAVRCLKSGAYDFVEKPFEDDVLLASVERAVERSLLRKESEELRKRINILSSDEEFKYGIVSRSRVMQDIYEQIKVFSRSDAPVLIYGETGVGKELIAKAIHNKSHRSKNPFVAVNAGALPDTTLESELFGHVKGAFTGAHADRDGKILTSSGGTLFLDEIESLSMKAQVELLRVLEDGIIQALGSDRFKKTDIRLITTTNVSPKVLLQQGQMRIDFLHRIMVLTIYVPSLRERVEDIPLLISVFLKEASQRNNLEIPHVPDNTLAKMLQYKWPGNVRELKHAVERMVITSKEGIIGEFIPTDSFDNNRLLSLPATAGLLHDELEKTERKIIEIALKENRGEVISTSNTLGISRRALYERMKKYGFNKEDFKK